MRYACLPDDISKLAKDDAESNWLIAINPIERKQCNIDIYMQGVLWAINNIDKLNEIIK